jgi:hypothetical protein
MQDIGFAQSLGSCTDGVLPLVAYESVWSVGSINAASQRSGTLERAFRGYAEAARGLFSRLEAAERAYEYQYPGVVRLARGLERVLGVKPRADVVDMDCLYGIFDRHFSAADREHMRAEPTHTYAYARDVDAKTFVPLSMLEHGIEAVKASACITGTYTVANQALTDGSIEWPAEYITAVPAAYEDLPRIIIVNRGTKVGAFGNMQSRMFFLARYGFVDGKIAWDKNQEQLAREETLLCELAREEGAAIIRLDEDVSFTQTNPKKLAQYQRAAREMARTSIKEFLVRHGIALPGSTSTFYAA